MYIYKPLPEGHPKAPAWQRVYHPDGVDPARLCLERGWAIDPPADKDIYDGDGSLFRAASEGAGDTVDATATAKAPQATGDENSAGKGVPQRRGPGRPRKQKETA